MAPSTGSKVTVLHHAGGSDPPAFGAPPPGTNESAPRCTHVRRGRRRPRPTRSTSGCRTSRRPYGKMKSVGHRLRQSREARLSTNAVARIVDGGGAGRRGGRRGRRRRGGRGGGPGL